MQLWSLRVSNCRNRIGNTWDAPFLHFTGEVGLLRGPVESTAVDVGMRQVRRSAGQSQSGLRAVLA